MDGLESQLNAIARELQALLARKSVQESELMGELGQIDTMLMRARAALMRERLESIAAPIGRPVYEQQLKRMLELVMDTEEAVRRGNFDTQALDNARMLIDGVRGRLALVRENPVFWTEAFSSSSRLSTLPRDVQRLVEKETRAPFRQEGASLISTPPDIKSLARPVKAYDTDGRNWAIVDDDTFLYINTSVKVVLPAQLTKFNVINLGGRLVPNFRPMFVSIGVNGKVYVASTAQKDNVSTDTHHIVLCYAMDGSLKQSTSISEPTDDYVINCRVDGRGRVWLVFHDWVKVLDGTTLKVIDTKREPYVPQNSFGCLDGLIWSDYWSWAAVMLTLRGSTIIRNDIQFTPVEAQMLVGGADPMRNSLFSMHEDRLVERMVDSKKQYEWPASVPKSYTMPDNRIIYTAGEVLHVTPDAVIFSGLSRSRTYLITQQWK